ncbi:putative monooxygenase [Sarocladium strictum]
MAFDKPVLVIGGGVVGLTLAHALKKAGIPFQVYERDANINAREQGWAITIHWALSTLRDVLDESTLVAVDAAQVDPEVGRHDTGNFLFLNLLTLDTKFRIPPNERRRLSREKFRRALYDGVKEHINWGKKLINVETVEDGAGIIAHFEDGSSIEGTMLVGAEGANSQTRQCLVPNAYRNRPIPVRFVGVALKMTPEQVKPLRHIDPLLFQGCHPETGNFLWISMMSTPESNGSQGTDDEHFLVQVNISWLNDDQISTEANTNESRLQEMRQRAKDFHPLLREVIYGIPTGTTVIEVVVQDWPCLPWDNRGGQVTLVGDSAHAMSMYRGEAANHGIMDAHLLAKALADVQRGSKSLETAIGQYENEMRQRTSVAVQLSRQACLDAHDYNGLNENSAVLKKRALK